MPRKTSAVPKARAVYGTATEQLIIRVSEDNVTDIRAAALRMGVTQTEFMRRAVLAATQRVLRKAP